MTVSTTGTSNPATKGRMKKREQTVAYSMKTRGRTLPSWRPPLIYNTATQSHQNCIVLHTARISVNGILIRAN
jgi:hypothetical protein